MDAAESLAFARKNPHAVLATMKRDGTPQLSPVLVGVDSQDRLVVSTRETAMKTLNVRRDPRAWLCVLNDRFFGDWAQLSGDVEVISLPEAMEPLVEYYRSISGERPLPVRLLVNRSNIRRSSEYSHEPHLRLPTHRHARRRSLTQKESSHP